MLKIVIGGPVWDKKHRAGRRFCPRHPSTTFFQHTFLL